MYKLENRISSREVAELMEVKHDNLLKKIDKINLDFTNVKIDFSKYWIESTYKVEGQLREYKEFKITIRGCEFLAHKTTGEKGNLFTNKYMDRFETMKEVIKNNLSLEIPTGEIAKQIAEIVQAEVQTEIQKINSTCSQYYKPTATDKFNASKYIKTRLGIAKANDEYEAVKQRIFFILGVKKWESISIETLKNSLNIIDESIRVIKADRPQQTTMF